MTRSNSLHDMQEYSSMMITRLYDIVDGYADELSNLESYIDSEDLDTINSADQQAKKKPLMDGMKLMI